MKLNIAERFSPTDTWEDGDDPRLFNYMTGLTAPSEEKEEDEEPRTRREGKGRTLIRRGQEGYTLMELVVVVGGVGAIALLVCLGVVIIHFLAKWW